MKVPFLGRMVDISQYIRHIKLINQALQGQLDDSNYKSGGMNLLTKGSYVPVNKTGDTMTGELEINNSLKMSATKDIYFTNDGYGIAWNTSGSPPRIYGADGGSISMVAGGGSAGFILDLNGQLALPLQPSVRARLSANQNNLTSGSWTTVQLDTEDYDLNADFNTGTYTFTAPVAGKYLVCAAVRFTSVVADKTYGLRFYVNGTTEASYSTSHASLADDISVTHSDVLNLAANDTVVLQAVSNAGVNTVDILSGAAPTFMSVRLLG